MCQIDTKLSLLIENMVMNGTMYVRIDVRRLL